MRPALATYATAAKVPAALAMKGAAAMPRQTVEPTGLRQTFDRGAEVFAEGDAADCFYKVVSGTVRTYKLLADGRRQIDAFHLAGDMFGIEAGEEHRFSAEAVGPVEVIAYRRSRLEAMSRNDAAFGAQVMSSMIRNLERAKDHMLLLGRKTAHEKIATFLLDLAERLHEDDHFELPMQRSDIADHLGLTIETVSRTLTDFARKGLIKLAASSRSVVLANKEGLQQLNA
jgi:CRP/FNR family transcriptional regulator, nitrogen fixation regulation protein